MITNCLLCGVGGQGTVLAAKILAEAAIFKGIEVKTTETIGMAQRGGSVVSHVRMGDNLHSPLIPFGEADIIIGFEPGEVVRNLNYLKSDGVIVVNKKAVIPTTATLSQTGYCGNDMIEFLENTVKNLIVVDGDEICNSLGTSKVLNVVLLGAALKTSRIKLEKEDILKALYSRIPEKLHEINLQALKAGNRL